MEIYNEKVRDLLDPRGLVCNHGDCIHGDHNHGDHNCSDCNHGYILYLEGRLR